MSPLFPFKGRRREGGDLLLLHARLGLAKVRLWFISRRPSETERDEINGRMDMQPQSISLQVENEMYHIKGSFLLLLLLLLFSRDSFLPSCNPNHGNRQRSFPPLSYSLLPVTRSSPCSSLPRRSQSLQSFHLLRQSLSLSYLYG